MATEKRLIDVNVPIRDLTAMKSMYDAISLDGIIKGLKDAPTVDAVEVVRCKECRDHNFCEIEDLLTRLLGIENPYCAAGKIKCNFYGETKDKEETK